MKKTTILLIVALLAVGVLGRLLPHLPNATPITALAFIGSMYFNRKTALLLPLAALLISDLLIGAYAFSIMLSVYGSFTLIALLSWYLRRQRSILAVGSTIIVGAFSFFLITNTAVWWFSPWYEKSLAGLLYSYQLGLPFLRNMLIGDFVYTFGLVGAFIIVPKLLQLGSNFLPELKVLPTSLSEGN